MLSISGMIAKGCVGLGLALWMFRFFYHSWLRRPACHPVTPANADDWYFKKWFSISRAFFLFLLDIRCERWFQTIWQQIYILCFSYIHPFFLYPSLPFFLQLWHLYTRQLVPTVFIFIYVSTWSWLIVAHIFAPPSTRAKWSWSFCT